MFICLLYFIFILAKLYTISKLNSVERSSGFKLPILKLFTKKTHNWIVVTSINDPTDQVKQLTNIENFQLLVIGDKKSKPNWSHGSTIHLDIKKQGQLKYNSFRTTPFNSYTRKNLGYLYAIQNGAKYIYDTDDDNVPLVNLTEYFNFNKYDYGLIINCDSPRVINPYAHFGQPLIWPRGYPLSEIQKNHYNNYVGGKRKTSHVQQGVVNGDPDVDAIFRLTKTMSYNKINVTFDETSPSIQYPMYKLVPYNSQNTFFHYEAFWSLYLPSTVNFRLTDIWRSYWAQRLMWLLNDTVTFNGPNAHQLRNSHSYLKDFESEKAMYTKTEQLVEFLFKWKCFQLKFYECMLDLSYQMAVEEFWEMNEVDGIKNWIRDLNSIGYIEPKIVTFDHVDVTNKCTNPIFDEFGVQHFPVRYTPKFQKSIDLDNYCCDGRIEEIYDNFKSITFLDEFCLLSNATLNLKPLVKTIEHKHRYSSITLLVTFNINIYIKNIEVIRHIYGNYFKNIVFCGLKIFNVLNETKNSFKKFDSYTFIDVNVGWAGTSHYYCMTKAIEMNMHTDGFLLMSDDVLLKYWQLDGLDLKKIWYPFKLECKQELVINSTCCSLSVTMEPFFIFLKSSHTLFKLCTWCACQ